jgi:hypothetical protein
MRRLLIVGLLLVLATPSIAGDQAFRVIVHPDNPIVAIDRDFLRAAFLKKKVEWRDGTRLRPVDLARAFPAREAFGREVLRKTPAQLKSYWNQQVFSGKGVPPPEVDSSDAMIDHVLAQRGAVGYLPAGVDPGLARVVELR